ncbi:MAG: hypothetical protein ACOVQR_10050 [Flavobacterium sp.]|jgi:hypothetical protein|uniref:hypothetical protein n=1 Tax=Flavobacterium sp. TaxID=239 RepID=UPI003BA6EEBE
MSKQIFPHKIHLNQIHWVVKETFILEKKLKKKPTYDFKIAHNVMHNLDKSMVKIRLFVDVAGVIDSKIIRQGGAYEIDFIFEIDEMTEQYEMIENKPVFNGLFVSTLMAISYSTLRGMLYELWKDTVLNGVILPVVSIPELFKNKR